MALTFVIFLLFNEILNFNCDQLNAGNMNQLCAVQRTPKLSLFCSRSNSINSVDKAFVGTRTSLGELEIKDQIKLKTLPKSLFKSVNSMTRFQLTNTGVESIDQIFTRSITIEELIVTDNQNLSHLDYSAFKLVKGLKVLDLSNNNLLSVPKDLFSNNKKTLVEIRLVGNKKLDLDEPLFDGLDGVVLTLCTRPTNDKIIISPEKKNYFHVGEEIDISCDHGLGTQNINSKCKANGRWTGSFPSCESNLPVVTFFAGFCVSLVITTLILLIRSCLLKRQQLDTGEDETSFYDDTTEKGKERQSVRQSKVMRVASEDSLLGVLTKIGYERHSYKHTDSAMQKKTSHRKSQMKNETSQKEKTPAEMTAVSTGELLVDSLRTDTKQEDGATGEDGRRKSKMGAQRKSISTKKPDDDSKLGVTTEEVRRDSKMGAQRKSISTKKPDDDSKLGVTTEEVRRDSKMNAQRKSISTKRPDDSNAKDGSKD